MNLIPDTEPALPAAAEQLAALAVAAIIPHERESPNPQNEPRGNAESLRETLTDVLQRPGPFHPGRDQASRRSVAGARQIAALGKIAGSIDLGPEIGRGGEHIVFRKPDDQDVGSNWNRKAITNQLVSGSSLEHVTYANASSEYER